MLIILSSIDIALRKKFSEMDEEHHNKSAILLFDDCDLRYHKMTVEFGIILSRVIIYCLLIAAGIFTNGIILYIFYKKPNLRCPINIFVINLAVTDIITSLLRQPFIVISLLYDSKSFIRNTCGFSGVTFCICHVVTVFTLVATAICRYLVIVRSFGKKISTKVVTGITIIIWIYATIDCLMPIFGWNRYVYQPEEYACLPDWQNSDGSGYIIYILIADSIIPWTISAICYINIYLNIKKHAYQMMRHLPSLNPTIHQQLHFQILKKEINITKTMFVFYIAFIGCYMPYCLTMFIFIPNHLKISHHFIFFVGYLLNLNSVINPVLYVILCKKIRQAAFEIFNNCSSSRSTIFYNCCHRTIVIQPYPQISGLEKTEEVQDINPN